jgi:hypothetical protein
MELLATDEAEEHFSTPAAHVSATPDRAATATPPQHHATPLVPPLRLGAALHPHGCRSVSRSRALARQRITRDSLLRGTRGTLAAAGGAGSSVRDFSRHT